MSCAFQEEEDFGKWGKGMQSSETGMGRGSSWGMLGKSDQGIFLVVMGCQARWDWKKRCLQSFQIREGRKEVDRRRKTIYNYYSGPGALPRVSLFLIGPQEDRRYCLDEKIAS